MAYNKIKQKIFFFICILKGHYNRLHLSGIMFNSSGKRGFFLTVSFLAEKSFQERTMLRLRRILRLFRVALKNIDRFFMDSLSLVAKNNRKIG